MKPNTAVHAWMRIFSLLLIGGLLMSPALPAQALDNGWKVETVPYLGMAFAYPGDWNFQPVPYLDFGFRIGSPDLAVDPLGRPLSGGYLAATVQPSTAEEWAAFASTHSRGTLVIDGFPTWEVSGVESDSFRYLEWHFFAYGRQHVIHFVASLDSFETLIPLATEMAGAITLTGSYEPEPLPPSRGDLLGAEAWTNPALLHAFGAGPGKIINDYNAGSHTGALDYGLDICGGAGCTSSLYNDLVYAPTDIKLIHNTYGYGMPTSSQDYHLFEISADASNKLCLAMGHFQITISTFTVGKSMPQQAQIGRIIRYTPSVNHIHMNLYTVPLSGSCGGTSGRVAVPFDSTRSDLKGQGLDGVDYHIGTSYVGAAVTSHNYGMCAIPTSTPPVAAAEALASSEAGIDCDGGGLSNDNASFVSDVTVPDGTIMSPGQSFTKTWRMLNTGSTTWGAGYTWTFTGGDQLGAPASVSVPTTAPNATADLSVNMTAPSLAGSYTGYWQLRNPQGQAFGTAVWVKITVSAPPSGAGQWHVEYFNSRDLGSRCYDGYEDSTYVFKNWGSGAPAGGCNTDNFSARFTRTYSFTGGNYSFHCQHDDGCRIYIDGLLKLDAWWDSSFTGHDWGGTLSGDHEVKIEFYDSGGDARLEAFWSGSGFLPSGPSCTSGEWCASYYGNKDLSGTPAVNRSEGSSDVDHDWGSGGLGYGFPADAFSVRWQRSASFEPGRYRFHMRVDDGGRLFVNNAKVIEQWKDQSATEYTADVDLPGGSLPVSFEYYESSGGAVAKLWWEVLSLSYPSKDLSVAIDGTGSGSVSGPGISCPGDCTETYAYNTFVTLTASPATGSVFSGWSGSCSGTGSCTVNMIAARSVTASFTVQALDRDTAGVFRPSNGVIYLKNYNTTGYADVALNYGIGGDYPVTGDWNGDGVDTIGVYRNGVFYLRNSNTVGYADFYFPFGTPGDQPVAGDWDGDGIDTIGVYNSRTITFSLRNSNTAGPADYVFRLGIPGDIGIAGDWTGKGFDTVGVFRPSNGVIFLKNTNQTGYADIAINYGIGGDKPVTGDWNSDGVDTIGVLRGNIFYLRNSNTIGYADVSFALGIPGDMPIAGNWDGLP